MSLKILVSAGEVSGDQHLARVVAALKCARPDCEVRGMAGRSCRDAGAVIDVDCYRAGAGMGFFELFRSGGKTISSFRKLSELLRRWKPDLLVVVDYPDFNLRLARVARRHGVKVLYFIPPKLWAWRSGRVRTIKRYINRVAAIFPFEEQFYQKHGYQEVTFVGHPLAEQATLSHSEAPRDDVLLFLPGSRRFEVERLLVPMLQAYGMLQRDFPSLIPKVVLAPNIEPAWVMKLIGDRIPTEVMHKVVWSHQPAIEAMRNARVGVLKSGTCNLEGAIAGLPFVCVYSGTLLAKIIISTFVALKEYSPVNIIKAHAVTELMQRALSPEDVAREVRAILLDGPRREVMLQDLEYVRGALAASDSHSAPGRSPGGDSRASTVADRVVQCIFEIVEDRCKPQGCSAEAHNV
jgi:lipid-A-disaccharide synthase